MIVISSAKDGFRRCGIAHKKEAVEYSDDDFTPEQLKELEAEPMLQVKKVKGRKKEEQ